MRRDGAITLLMQYDAIENDRRSMKGSAHVASVGQPADPKLAASA